MISVDGYDCIVFQQEVGIGVVGTVQFENKIIRPRFPTHHAPAGHCGTGTLTDRARPLSKSKIVTRVVS
jgi:hypothetical protein